VIFVVLFILASSTDNNKESNKFFKKLF
jgi:hypothetical protein